MTTPAMTDQDRELFEAYAQTRNLHPLRAQVGKRYYFADTNEAWHAWQAARALPQQVVAAGGIDMEALRKLALAATPGPWHIVYGDDLKHMNMTAITADPKRTGHAGQFGADENLVAVTFHQSYPVVDADPEGDDCGDSNSAFIAAANPATILRLLDALDARQPAPVKLEGLGMRELVARAICTACEENPEHKGDARGNDKRWQDYLHVADAAILAKGAKHG